MAVETRQACRKLTGSGAFPTVEGRTNQRNLCPFRPRNSVATPATLVVQLSFHCCGIQLAGAMCMLLMATKIDRSAQLP